MKKIIVLNYNNGVVYIVEIPKSISNVENYLYDNYNFKESEIYWMDFCGKVKVLNFTDINLEDE
jgi:hypothetical protein